MEADILESKKDLYLVQKYGGRYFEKVLFINLFYFVVSIGITACSIIMDVALVIKTAEQYVVYFVATKLMSSASYSFHFVVHLFVIYNNKTNDLILNLTPENVTQHSRIE